MFLRLFKIVLKLFTIMSGEELKQYIKHSGLTMSDIAREMGTTPQNIQARLTRKSIKTDFWLKVKEIIDRCCPPLPAEMEAAVIGSNVNGSNSSNVSQSIGGGDALARENEVLRQQNAFLQEQVKTLLAIVKEKN